jgi:hypothetical protein
MINSNGQKEVYAVVGPNCEIDFLPVFDKNFIETDIVLHEFGNPITDKYERKINDLKEKYYTVELQKTGKENGYEEWKDVFNELILRATTIKITEKYFGKAQAKKNLDWEISEGFGLVESILKILDEYEQNRNLYPTFDKFFPVLLERMK